jgi:hypothetical protein
MILAEVAGIDDVNANTTAFGVPKSDPVERC